MPGRVLMVAYNFPPVGGVGMLRSLKYATYLPEAGWEPIVLTALDPSGYLDLDAERSLPANLRVERAFAPDPVKARRFLGRTARELLSLFRSKPGPGGARLAEAAASGGVPTRGASPSPWQKRMAAIWAAGVRATCYPDDEVGWVPFAVRRGLRIHAELGLDAIYSSSPPVSCHLAAAVIARQTGLPWIADFRDPWIGNAFAAPPGRIHALLQRRIERRIVENADRVVFASEGLTEAYAGRYPWAADRFETIPNGYDRADLAVAGAAPDQAVEGDARAAAEGRAHPTAADGLFHLVYGGSIYGEHELEIFLEGLRRLVERRPEVRRRLRVEFVGWLNLHNQAVAARYDRPDCLGGMLAFEGFLPHREAVARLARADALLQIIADEPNKGQIQGGKLMEYVGLDRQIFAVVPPGRARDLLAELDWGIVADPTPASVAEGLERLLAEATPTRRADPESRYDRRNLTRRLAAVLDDVTAIAFAGPAEAGKAERARARQAWL